MSLRRRKKMRQIHHRSAAMAALTQPSNPLIRIDNPLRMCNRFEPGFYRSIQLEIPVTCRMTFRPRHPPPACGEQSPPSRRTPECAKAAL